MKSEIRCTIYEDMHASVAIKAANADEDLTAVRFLFTQLQSTANRINEHLSKLKDKNPEQADKLKSVMCETLAKISSSMEEII